jgi:hypothetical protein
VDKTHPSGYDRRCPLASCLYRQVILDKTIKPAAFAGEPMRHRAGCDD